MPGYCELRYFLSMQPHHPKKAPKFLAQILAGMANLCPQRKMMVEVCVIIAGHTDSSQNQFLQDVHIPLFLVNHTKSI